MKGSHGARGQRRQVSHGSVPRGATGKRDRKTGRGVRTGCVAGALWRETSVAVGGAVGPRAVGGGREATGGRAGDGSTVLDGTAEGRAGDSTGASAVSGLDHTTRVVGESGAP